MEMVTMEIINNINVFRANKSLAIIIKLTVAAILGLLVGTVSSHAQGVTLCQRKNVKQEGPMINPRTRVQALETSTNGKCRKGFRPVVLVPTLEDISDISTQIVEKRLTTVSAQKGDKGEPGVKGDTGPQGIVGPMGPRGETGPTGAQGVAGPQGAAGPQGIAGPKGDAGAMGPQGAVGPQGIPGPQGPAGSFNAGGLGLPDNRAGCYWANTYAATCSGAPGCVFYGGKRTEIVPPRGWYIAGVNINQGSFDAVLVCPFSLN